MNTPRTESDRHRAEDRYRHECNLTSHPPIIKRRGEVHRLRPPLVCFIVVLALVVIVFLATLMIVKTCALDADEISFTDEPLNYGAAAGRCQPGDCGMYATSPSSELPQAESGRRFDSCPRPYLPIASYNIAGVGSSPAPVLISKEGI